MRDGAATVKRITLELGGKSPLMVMDDANIEKAATAAFVFGFLNSGQFCMGATRLLVQEGAYDEFVARLVGMAQTIKVGAWHEEGVFMGPVVSENQANKIMEYIEIGKQSGAKLALGGNRIDREGFFIEPTIFTEADNSMRQVREEIFGPVLNVVKFKTLEEGLAIANDSPYGLTSSIFTSNMNTAHVASKKLQTGTVWVNNFFGLCMKTSFGGYKNSGVGRELGDSGLSSYLEDKTIGFDMS